MAQELWGMQGGSRQAEEDLLGQQVQQVSMAHTLGQIAMQPAQGRLLNAQAGQAEQALSDQQRMGQLLSTMGQGGTPQTDENGKPLSLADSFSRLATKAFQAGLPAEAGKYATLAGNMAYKDVQAASARATQAKNLMAAEHQKLQLYEGFTRGVDSQESFDRANTMYEQATGTPAPFAGVVYTPDRMEALRNSVLARKDAIAEADRQVSQQETHEYHQATNEFRDSRLKQHDAEQEVRAAREARIAKNGGKPLTAPSKAEFTPAMDILQSELFNGVLPEGDTLSQMKIAATDLASEAKRKTAANRGLDYGTALHQAYEESKSRGDWQDIQSSGAIQDGIKAVTGIDVGKKGKKYSPLGGSPDRPAPAPKSAEEATVGRFYRAADGRVGKWTGKGFDLVLPKASGGAAGGGGGGGAGSVPDDDDEEEE